MEKEIRPRSRRRCSEGEGRSFRGKNHCKSVVLSFFQ
jgi:hypothetical protein